jgi:ribosome-associated heat shock protein Hsp15
MEHGRVPCFTFLISRRSFMRIDKWLWAARFYKTRQLAAKACDLGRVRVGGVLAKPAREVRLGDRVFVLTEGGEFTVEVVALSEKRGPAAVAQTLFAETAESRAAREQLREQKRLAAQFEVLPQARPDKRDRRTLNRLRGRS